MEPAVFQVVCVPLLGVAHTALLGISTPDDEFNFYSSLFDIKDEVTGETLFYLIQIGLACDECLRHGLACTHKIDRLPHWKTAERQALVQSILASNPALANREAAGIINKSERYLFDRIFLDKLQKKTTYHWRFNPSVLFCAIDPAGGGSQSDFSVATLAFDTGQIVLLGLESTNKVQEKNIVCLLESHFRALRKIERYKDSFIFIFIERNYGGTFVTDTIKNIVEQSDFAPLQVVCCDIKKGDKPGVWVDEPTKQAMCGDLVRLLMEERLHFANPAEFITHRMSMNRKIRSDVLDCQKELIEQLSRVRDVISKTEKNEEVGIAKKITTGKGSGGRKDDMAICLMLAYYFGSKQRVSPSYQATAKNLGWRF